MPSLSSRPLPRNWRSRFTDAWSYLRSHLNFYRIHILVFTFTPLVFSGIVYAVNGKYPVAYIDCLFNSVSAMTVCGLATIDLSRMTPFQQVLLFIQMCLGSPVAVSWVMVYIRRTFFARKFQYIMEAKISRELSEKIHRPVKVKITPLWRRAARLLLPHKSPLLDDASESADSSSHDHRRSHASRVRPDMIRRMDEAPRLVNPSGWISEGRTEPLTMDHPRKVEVHQPEAHTPQQYLSFSDIDNPDLVDSIAPGQSLDSPEDGSDTASQANDQDESEHEFEALRQETPDGSGRQPGSLKHRPQRVFSDPAMSMPFSESPVSETPEFNRSHSINVAAQSRQPNMPHTQTVEFAFTPHPVRQPRSDRELRPLESILQDRTDSVDYFSSAGRRRGSMRSATMSLPHSVDSRASGRRTTTHAMHSGFGGFPMPHEIATSLVRRFFPNLERQLTRTVTIPRTRTIASHRGSIASGAHPVSYISFEAVVGRNSNFKALTREQQEELGGVEYRALGALLWIVGAYHILSQLLAFVVIAPYISIPRWSGDFKPPQLFRDVSPVWFSAFQVVSAYTNTGMSLVDQSMIPFQRAYPMIFMMIFLILAGNTAFPVFLRFTIWLITKVVRQGSRVNETLHFLLDHPRRCFVYLFPSHQTWFLWTIIVSLTMTDWFFFLILDLGNSAVTSIPPGVRVIDGLLQAAAVRGAGFGVVALSAIAPAVKVLYVVMMYVSIYPVAMSVRSTNVYEEKSLGVFDDDEESVDEEFQPTGSRITVWSRYLAMHMRKQLSFDMWWLGTALFLICIIERDSLDNEANATWFNIFRILFEIVSAYGTVGLSLGVPTDNFSFSGALRPLSKLIVCVVMLRGRHRGLPVAIDRAVMLPFEFNPAFERGSDDQAEGETYRPGSRNGTAHSGFMNEKSPPRVPVQRNFTRPDDQEGAREMPPRDAQRRSSRIRDEEVHFGT